MKRTCAPAIGGQPRGSSNAEMQNHWHGPVRASLVCAPRSRTRARAPTGMSHAAKMRRAERGSSRPWKARGKSPRRVRQRSTAFPTCPFIRAKNALSLIRRKPPPPAFPKRPPAVPPLAGPRWPTLRPRPGPPRAVACHQHRPPPTAGRRCRAAPFCPGHNALGKF